MVQPSNYHADLKVWTARQVSAIAQPVPSFPRAADQNGMTVEEATRGMTESKKFLWLQEQVEQTIKDMEAKGIHVDRSKIMYADLYGGPDNDNNTRIIHAGNLPPGATVQDLKMVLAHEIDHSQQNTSPRPGLNERQRLERHADHTMAVVYGGQNVIDLMNNFADADPGSLRRHDPKDPHDSWLSRMQRIKHDFPEQNVQLPKGAPHIRKDKSKKMAGSAVGLSA